MIPPFSRSEAMRSYQCKTCRRVSVYVPPTMSQTHVRGLLESRLDGMYADIPLVTNLTRYIPAIVRIARFLVSSVNGCAPILHTFMRCKKMLYISVGAYTEQDFRGCHRTECLFRQEHPCLELCQYPGLCRIETTPQSIEETFTGKHETFQYTKVCFSVFRK